MAGWNTSAQPIEGENGYYCSRCKNTIDKYASACPHCHRNVGFPDPPFWNTIIRLGIILFLSGGLFFFFVDAHPLQSTSNPSYSIPLRICILGIALIPGAYAWHYIYWISVMIKDSISSSIWWMISPIANLIQWVAKSTIKVVRWCIRTVGEPLSDQKYQATLKPPKRKLGESYRYIKQKSVICKPKASQNTIPPKERLHDQKPDTENQQIATQTTARSHNWLLNTETYPVSTPTNSTDIPMATDDQTALESFDKAPIPDDACIRYEDCGETVPGRATMCSSCLDEARKRDREANYDTYHQRLTEQSTEHLF